jgi:hypothetical protein
MKGIQKMSKKVTIVILIAMGLLVSLVATASEKTRFPGLNCRSNYYAGSDGCFDPQGDNNSTKNRCSSTKGLVCPITLVDWQNSNSDTVDYASIGMDSTSGTSCWLSKSMTGSATHYSPNKNGGTYMAWTTDRGIIGVDGISFDFTIGCNIASGKKVYTYGVILK